MKRARYDTEVGGQKTTLEGGHAAQHRVGTRGPVPAPLGRAAEPFYAAAVRLWNRRYDAGRGVVRLPVPVVSVGNLSVGGTGKTPMVAHLVRELSEHGCHPCIAMRGYAKGDGLSDEAAWYRDTFPHAPVVAQPDRAAGVRTLLASEEGRNVDCVLLDDGFQHRRLSRDFDLVLIDASRSPFADRLLPAGWLREPVASLRRAGAVILTHTELARATDLARLEAQIHAVHGRYPIARTRHTWGPTAAITTPTSFTHGSGSPESVVDTRWLIGRRIVAVCAIGHPDSFIGAVAVAMGEGGQLAGRIVLPDHDPYRPGTVRRIIELARSANAGAIVTTEKDWSKLSAVPRASWPCPVVRPVLEIDFVTGRETLTEAIVNAVSAHAAPAPAPHPRPA